jgi:hypothetical protein
MNALRAGMSAAPLSANVLRASLKPPQSDPKAVVRFCLQNAARRGKLRFDRVLPYMERDMPWLKTPKRTILPRNGWKCRLIELPQRASVVL